MPPLGLISTQNQYRGAAVSSFGVAAGSGTTSTDPMQGPMEPALHASLIVTSDTTALGFTTRGISMAAAGALRVGMADGTNLVIPSGALAAGIIHPLAVTQVYSTSTTATGMVGFY